MPSPQIEGGYTRIQNELLDAIVRHGFSKRELTLVLAVIRKTNGFNKREDDMTLTQLANQTGIKLSHVSETVRDLAARRVFLFREGDYGYVIGINKNYADWAASRNGNRVPKTGTSGSQNGKHKRQPQKTNTPPNPPRGEALVGIDRFMEMCREQDVKPIPPDDPVFEYAADVGLPTEFLRLYWREFVQRHRDKGKRQRGIRGWRQAFRNHIRNNYYRLWWSNSASGQYELTTTGMQARAKAEADARKEAVNA